jgi:hypothetical protein
MPRTTAETEDRAEELEQEVHDLQEDRSRIGTVARELDLRALANQHRAAFTALIESLDKAARKAQKEGWGAGRRYLITHTKADIHMVGFAATPVVKWFIRNELKSPIRCQRLLRPDVTGEEARAHFLEYVEENMLAPGLERLWRQLGGPDQEPLNA